MLSRYAIVALLAVASVSVDAQSISDIPQCAVQAVTSSMGSTVCKISDFPCLCKERSFISSLLPIVQKACSPADLQKTIEFTQRLCDTVGITLTISTSTPTSTPSGTSTPEPASSTASGLSVSSGPNATVKAIPAITITASPNSTASNSSQLAFTGASPRHDVQKFGALAIVVAAVFPMI